MSAPTAPAQQPPIEAVREVCARGHSKVCSCTYAAKTSLPPCRAAVAIAVLEARVAKLEAALRIADAACATYYEWEYGTDLEAEVNASLLVAWKKDHDARAALTPEPR